MKSARTLVTVAAATLALTAMRRSDGVRTGGASLVSRRTLALVTGLLMVVALVLACSVTALTKPTPRSEEQRPLTEVERKKKEGDRDAGTHPEHEGPPPRYGDRVVREPLR